MNNFLLILTKVSLVTRELTSFKYVALIQLQIFVLVLIIGIPVSSSNAADYWPKEKWRTATPESQGMSSEVLSDMMDQIWQKEFAIDSLLIIRNGHVVLDAYNYAYTPDYKHIIYSCTKSVSSALIGIAVDKGYIKTIDQPLLDFFPDIIPKNRDARKQKITLKHVLMMATGLKCRDSYLYGWSGLWDMKASEDWVQHMIDLPMLEDPGTRFEYCNGASFLLAAILQKTTGKTALEFAEENLFHPLGINNIEWPANPQGITIGYSELYMRPRDMARFGYLFLNNGKWNGQQIVPAEWVVDSTQKHISATLIPGYGYQWWIMSPDRYAAVGYAGQRIFVLKDKQMVVVFTSQLGGAKARLPMGILRGYIIPAVNSDIPLPENPKALNRLRFLERFWTSSNYADREKKREELVAAYAAPKRKTYVDKQFRFSVEYDAELIVSGQALKPPLVFSQSGLTGMPVLAATVDDIPNGLKLNESEEFVVRLMKKMNQVSDIKVNHKEMIHSADGIPVNYYEISAKYQIYQIVVAGVIGYKNKKLISVSAVGGFGTSIEHLKGMVTSLKLNLNEG